MSRSSCALMPHWSGCIAFHGMAETSSTDWRTRARFWSGTPAGCIAGTTVLSFTLRPFW